MSREIILQTRNTILKGRRPGIEVPPAANLKTPAPDGWAKVLGAFAAVYKLEPTKRDVAGGISTDAPAKRLVKGPYDSEEDIKKAVNAIDGKLSASIKYKDVGRVVDFSAPSRLLEWADGQMSASVFGWEDAPDEEVSELMTETLTNRGIATLADIGIVSAGLLTELLSSDNHYRRDPSLIRKIITERGHGLLVPMMASQRFFTLAGNYGIESDLLTLPRKALLQEAKDRITYLPKDGTVEGLRWKFGEDIRNTGGNSCPFLLAERGKLVQPAWKLLIDTIWDPVLDWRVRNPIQKSEEV